MTVEPASNLRVRADGKFVAVHTSTGWVLWRTDSPRVQAVTVGEAEVSDWLPLVVVSPAPDTEDFPLRQQLARVLIRASLGLDANDDQVIDMAKALNLLVSLVTEREEPLRADLRIRYHALANALGLPHDADEVAGYYAAVDQVAGLRADLDQARAERDSARAARDRMLSERTVAARVSRTIPNDAAERLRKLAVDFRSRSDQSVVDALATEHAEDECDSPAECHGAAACWTWKLAARQVEKLAESLSTPATGPAPAAADRPRWVQRGLHHHRCAVRAGAADCTCGVEPAAPQAPAEQCAWRYTTSRCPDPAIPGGPLCTGHGGNWATDGPENDDAQPPAVVASHPLTEHCRRCTWDTAPVDTATERQHLADPGEPKATAEPTGVCPHCHCAEPIHKTWCEPAPAAREDTAPPTVPLVEVDGYGDDIGGWNHSDTLRPAPAVDGDTQTTPTSEEG